MNWKLILSLSILGVAMAIAGVFGFSGMTSTIVWLLIFIIYAVIIVWKAKNRYFLHAFLVSVLNGLWIGIVQAVFITTYFANHHVISRIYKMLPLNSHRRVLMVITGVLIGVISGPITGLITFAAGRLMKRRSHVAQS